MTRLRLGVPLWLARRRRSEQTYQQLRGNLTVDVAIVGGGITGAVLAWRLADAGVRVAVLEAAHVGRGRTAASTALLMQEPDNDFVDLAQRYGRRRAQRIWELSRLATRGFIEALRQLRIRCELRSCDSVYCALTPEHTPLLRREHQQRIAAGLGGRWLAEQAVRRVAGLDSTVAIRTTGNAQADPYRACLGFLRAASARGARVYERSSVETIEPSAHTVTIATARGRVTADRVMVATGYATPSFEPLAGRFRLLTTYAIATRPIAMRERRTLGIGDVMLWDTGRPYHYGRWTTDHRLVLGGGDRPRVDVRNRERALADGARAVREHFVARYPTLDAIPIEYAWEGLFAMTPDGLPYIGPHRRYPRHLFALGYGGNGMTFGFLAATLLLDWYRGKQSTDHDLFAFGRLR